MRAGIVVNVTRADRLRLEAIVADRSAPQKHVWRAKARACRSPSAARLNSHAHGKAKGPAVCPLKGRHSAPMLEPGNPSSKNKPRARIQWDFANALGLVARINEEISVAAGYDKTGYEQL
jgi:hypothetical protein